jgi:hypothetical protein
VDLRGWVVQIGTVLGRLSRHDLTDKEWERLEGLLPVDPPRGGRRVGHRTVINGILFRRGRVLMA